MGHLDVQGFSRFPAQRFIETGFGGGKTLIEAAKFYPECFSIELHPGRYMDAMKMFAGQPHVKIFNGNSPDILPSIIDPAIKTVFWLDAHYVEGDTVKVEGHGLCPILKELEIIKGFPWVEKPVILIDDWSTFRLAESFKWPGFKQLDAVMGTQYQRFKDLPTGEVFGYV